MSPLKFVLILFLFPSRPAWAECGVTAQTQGVSGDVRIKHPGVPNWEPVASDAQVKCGDLLYVSDGAEARLFYLREKSAVVLTPRSIFEVEERLPLATKFKRSFGNSNYQGGLVPRELSPDGKFSKTLMAPNRENMGEMEASLQSGSANTVVERRVIPLRFVDPPGPLRVVARKFPVSVSISLEYRNANARLFGYLWNESGSVAPVWTGMSDGVFSDLPFETPGRYIFQALSEDDAYASNALTILVEKLDLRVGPSLLLPGKWEGRTTVWMR